MSWGGDIITSPRVLLRRFASRTSEDSDKAFIWQISKTRPPIEISIRDAAVGRDFYGLDGELEGQFGSLEGELGIVLRSIESGADPQTHAELLRRYVWVQSMRTKAIKDQLNSLWRSTMGEFKRSAETANLVERLTHEITTRFDELADAHMQALPLSEQILYRNMLAVPHFRQMALDAMTHKMVTSDIATIVARMIALISDKEVVRDTVDKGMNKGLTSLLNQDEFVPKFSPAFWSTHDAAPHTFVLGDLCVFAIDAQGSVGSVQRLIELMATCIFPRLPFQTACGIAFRRRASNRLSSCKSRVSEAICGLDIRDVDLALWIGCVHW